VTENSGPFSSGPMSNRDEYDQDPLEPDSRPLVSQRTDPSAPERPRSRVDVFLTSHRPDLLSSNSYVHEGNGKRLGGSLPVDGLSFVELRPLGSLVVRLRSWPLFAKTCGSTF
jgi:hypothetical protein